MDRQVSVPLFALRQPLFPGVPLALRIFEQRYLRLVREALRESSGFAVVPIISGHEVGAPAEVHRWGTWVTIRDWSQGPDGLLGITVAGDQRLQTSGIDIEKDGLLRAKAILYPPDPQESVGEEDADLLDLLTKLATWVGRRELMPEASLSVATLGWRLLSLLPFDNDWRIAQLGVDNPQQRLQAIRQHLLQLSQS